MQEKLTSIEQRLKNAQPFPFWQILSLIFITLKLTGDIAWSWFWVLSPIFLVLLGRLGEIKEHIQAKFFKGDES